MTHSEPETDNAQLDELLWRAAVLTRTTADVYESSLLLIQRSRDRIAQSLAILELRGPRLH